MFRTYNQAGIVVAGSRGKGPVFLNDEPFPLATAMASFPPSAANRGKYLRVSDLYGSEDGALRCGYDGTMFYWKPVTPEFAKTLTISSSDITVTPLGSPTLIKATGSVAAGMTKNFNVLTDFGYPGAQKRFKVHASTVLIGMLRIVAVGITSPINLALNSDKSIFMDYVGGALQWNEL